MTHCRHSGRASKQKNVSVYDSARVIRQTAYKIAAIEYRTLDEVYAFERQPEKTGGVTETLIHLSQAANLSQEPGAAQNAMPNRWPTAFMLAAA